MQKVVIVGGGHAAAQLCASLIEGGFPGSVTLVCEEATLPYHRPPLSKTYLKTQDAAVQLLRPEATYADAGVQVLLADPAVGIDRDARRLTLASGKQLDYDALVLATGTRARRLPDLPDDLQNLIYLRNAGDAARLRAAIAEAPSVTVVGRRLHRPGDRSHGRRPRPPGHRLRIRSPPAGALRVARSLRARRSRAA
jgi:3-phenylpropionate/trans-cinnamate dioxygenase ferredoxin reductase subunit